MLLVAEYLQDAAKYQRMAEETDDSALREALMRAADACRKSAERRAALLNLPPVNLPTVIPRGDKTCGS